MAHNLTRAGSCTAPRCRRYAEYSPLAPANPLIQSIEGAVVVGDMLVIPLNIVLQDIQQRIGRKVTKCTFSAPSEATHLLFHYHICITRHTHFLQAECQPDGWASNHCVAWRNQSKNMGTGILCCCHQAWGNIQPKRNNQHILWRKGLQQSRCITMANIF